MSFRESLLNSEPLSNLELLAQAEVIKIEIQLSIMRATLASTLRNNILWVQLFLDTNFD